MTNTELIAEARKFLATPNLGKVMARELDKALIYIRRLADALESAMIPHAECEASGERAGAQLADLKAALEAAEARVKGFEANFPCDGGCNYDSGPEESCSLHGRNPADLWGIIANISAECYEAEARIAELKAGEWEYAQAVITDDDGGLYLGKSFGDDPTRALDEGYVLVRRNCGPWVPVESED